MKSTRSLITAFACAGLGLALPLGATASDDDSDVATFAGNGVAGFFGDGGQAGLAELNAPRSVANAPGGGYLVVDTFNNRIRKIAPDGTITTVAGDGTAGYGGDGGPATSASIYEPRGVAPTGDGGYLIADTENERIRKVSPGGTITTVAGTGNEGLGLIGSLLDGLLGTDNDLDHPSAVSPTSDGGFLIADTENNVIRKVSALGTVGTVAGDGTGGYAGDGADATASQLCAPEDVAATSDGGYLIADTGNNAIRKVAADGTITTVAGDGTQGYTGDEGAPELAQLNAPAGVEAESNGSFLIADTGNHVVRRVKNGEIRTKVAAARTSGSNPLSGPRDVLSVGEARLVADTGNNRIALAGSVDPTTDDHGGNLGVPVALPAALAPTPELPKPEAPLLGWHMQVEHSSGTVTVKLPNSGTYVELDDAASVPVGSVVDATRGKVTLTSARDSSGKTQSAAFSGGRFKLEQKRSGRPVTDLVLRGGDFAPCWRRGTAGGTGKAQASATSKRKVRRRLWGSGHGRFRTRGRHGAATVRGTIWLTEDSCAGTRVYVRRGLVAVRDFTRKRTVMVPKRHAYLARSHKPRKRTR